MRACILSEREKGLHTCLKRSSVPALQLATKIAMYEDCIPKTSDLAADLDIFATSKPRSQSIEIECCAAPSYSDNSFLHSRIHSFRDEANRPVSLKWGIVRGHRGGPDRDAGEPSFLSTAERGSRADIGAGRVLRDSTCRLRPVLACRYLDFVLIMPLIGHVPPFRPRRGFGAPPSPPPSPALPHSRKTSALRRAPMTR